MSKLDILGVVLAAFFTGWLACLAFALSEAPQEIPEPEPTVLEKYAEVLKYCGRVGRNEIAPEPAIALYCARLRGTSKTDI